MIEKLPDSVRQKLRGNDWKDTKASDLLNRLDAEDFNKIDVIINKDLMSGRHLI